MTGKYGSGIPAILEPVRAFLTIFLLSGVAWGQIQPEAARLYHAAAVQALQNLQSFDLEADVEISIPTVTEPQLVTKHIVVSVRKPARQKLSVEMKTGTDTFIVTDNSVWVSDQYSKEYGERQAILRPDSFLNPVPGRELLPTDHSLTGAEIVRDETLQIEGREFPCTVIRVTAPSNSLAGVEAETSEVVWIDKQTGVPLRRETASSLPHSGASKITVTRFLTGDAVQQVGFEHVPPNGWHENDGHFDSIMLALPVHGADFVFSTPDGQRYTALNLAGKPTLLSFTSPGCVPCEEELKDFEVAAKTLKATWGDAIRVIVTDPEQASRAGSTRTAVAESPDYITVFATPEQVERQGIQVLPATMATTPYRTIYRTVQGRISQQEMMNLIGKAKEQRPLSAADIYDMAFVSANLPGVVVPVPLFQAPVAMTSEAKALRISGTVFLTAAVRQDGTVKDVTVTRSLHPALDAIAQDAVKKWLFKPGMRFGQPCNVYLPVRIEFKPAP